MSDPNAHHTLAPQVPHPASYRDPAGFVFTQDGILYRQVNQSYARQYAHLINSGLYDKLTGESLLISHTEVATPAVTADPSALSPDLAPHLTLLPQQIRRISYPSEWCPEQLKDAALTTLKIQRVAMDHGMTLKDASPFNIQFDIGRPIFIDTLSFDLYDPAKPWIAYRQFCENFLFPLYIHRYAQTGTHQLSTAWPDGIPAATTARLLPWKSRFNPGAALHVFLQSRIGARSNPQKDLAANDVSFSKTKLTRLIEHLHSIVSGLNPAPIGDSTWSNYYDETILGQEYLKDKTVLFRQYLHDISFADALDLGSNDGWFSKILAETGATVIAADSDWQCIDRLYRNHIANILPLCVDLTNPTPASGFGNAERASFTDRTPSDLVTALALIHHLTLGHNIPIPLIAGYLSQLTKKYLIVEFVPLSDPKAAELTARKEILPGAYDFPNFEAAFSAYFLIEQKDTIPGTGRILYLLKKRTP